MADRVEDGVDFFRDPFANLLTFFSQAQRTSVPFGIVGSPADKSVAFQIVQRPGNRRLVFLAMLAQLCRSHAVQRIYVVQTGHMGTPQMIGSHLLIFYPPYVAADPVDQNRKPLKSLLHGCLLSSKMLKFQQADFITQMLKCQHSRSASYCIHFQKSLQIYSKTIFQMEKKNQLPVSFGNGQPSSCLWPLHTRIVG